MKKFALMGLSLLSIFALAACSSDSTKSSEPKKADETTTVSTETTATEKTTFKVGEKIVFEGIAEYTITNVEWTDERNEFEDSQPEKVLKVTYNVVNLTKEDYLLGSDLTLYVGSNKMEEYANTNTFDTISAGRSFEGATQHFGVNGTDTLEIEIEPSWTFDYDGNPAIVTLDIK